MRRVGLAAAGVTALLLVAAACQGPRPLDGDEAVVDDAFVTAYSWHDNTPPGSTIISNPVLHDVAGGTGTFEDPVTIAVGHSRETGRSVLDFPAGTRIYLPNVRRYFIVEDACGDGPTPEEGPCHVGADDHGDASVWIDIWIGGDGESARFVRDCALRVTGVQTAVFNPGDQYVVAPGEGVIHDGECDSGYGNDLVTR
ncbi:hypothetical protein [Pseudarthrobacter phenanthrenivorans]|uniref:hypothetical protein n=1 Tax=Pseudarthrobacter phenanthrenivorans TaxID=361575 RepID=UPI001C63F4D8|nr:hypothetical protein [Pseudarthrobacter phenanthrenivorans]